MKGKLKTKTKDLQWGRMRPADHQFDMPELGL